MIIKEISREDLNEFFMNDPKLCYIGLSDNSMATLYHHGHVELPSLCVIYGIYREDELVCCVRSDPWSEIATCLHIYISTKLHGTDTSKEIQKLVAGHIKDNTVYTKIIICTPSPCLNVIGAANTFGLKLEGRITNCVIWRQKPADMLIFGLDL
jgi:hypothetical protein